MLYDL
jgi:lysyl-tRNA synthetase class I